MKFYKLLLICILVGLTFDCSNTQSVNIPATTDEVVLEVITNAIGSAYPKEGDILQIRLCESGRFEYDDFPDYNPPKISSYNVLVRKKEANLNSEDVKELMDLANQPDFLSAKDEYAEIHPDEQGDTAWITKIKFMYEGPEKRIVAVNFWNSQYRKEDKLKYPPSMVKLLERVEELKAKAIGRTSTQWLAPQSNKSSE